MYAVRLELIFYRAVNRFLRTFWTEPVNQIKTQFPVHKKSNKNKLMLTFQKRKLSILNVNVIVL